MNVLTPDTALPALRAGGVIAYPTEAVWGLGCDPGHEAAVMTLLTIKQRPIEKGMILVAAPVQIFIGDMHGLNTLEHQPAKVMAMEGHFESHPDGAPLILFGIPDREAATVHGAVEIPKLSSLILKHDPNAPLAG
uniref:cytochrome ubiquinol oxidase subunit I n=1 Tax=Stenotrophomonas sp. TaxID=69392 RepID=UPI00289704CB